MDEMNNGGGVSKKRSWGTFLLGFLLGLVFVLIGCGITFFKVISPLTLLDPTRYDNIMFMHIIVFCFPLAGLNIMLGNISAFFHPSAVPTTHRIPLVLHPLYLVAIPVALYLPYGIFLFSVFIKHPPPWHVWLLLLPPLILTLILLHQCVLHKTFKGACLDLTHSAIIGDTLTGAIHIPTPVEGKIPVILRCDCEDWENGDRSVSVFWKTKTIVTAISDGITATIPIHVTIPPGKPATTHPDAKFLRYTWQLRVKVKHFWLAFEVPVRSAQKRA